MTRSLVPQRMRGLPRAVWVLVAGTLITRAGSFAIPFMTIYLHTERGLSLQAAGTALGAYGAGGIVAALTGGTLADRLGRKPVVVGAPLLGGLAVVGLLISQHAAVVVAMAFVAGMVSEAGRPAVSAMITDLTTIERRVDAIALFRLTINLGFAVGTGLGGVLITQFGFAPLFIADAVTSWVYAVIALALLPETKPRTAHAPDAPRRGFGTVLADRTMRRYWLGTFVGAIVFAQPMTTLALVLTGRGLSTAVCGALISANGVLIIATEFWLSGRTRRYAPHRVMALGTVLIGGGYAVTGAVGTSIPLLVATVLIWTTGEMLTSPTGHAYMSAIAPPDLRGRYAGAVGLAWSLAFTIGPILGTTALERSTAAYWGGAVVLSVVSAALFLTLPAVSLTGAEPAIPPGLPERPADPAPVASPEAVPEQPRGSLLPRFARPRS